MSGHVVIGKNGIRKPDFILKGFDNTNTFRILADLLMNRENGKVKGRGKAEHFWQKLWYCRLYPWGFLSGKCGQIGKMEIDRWIIPNVVIKENCVMLRELNVSLPKVWNVRDYDIFGDSGCRKKRKNPILGMNNVDDRGPNVMCKKIFFFDHLSIF